MDPLHLDPPPGWLTAEIVRWLDAQLGSVAVRAVHAHTAELHAPGRGTLWLKQLSSGRSWAQATAARARLAPALRRAGFGVPRAVARFPRLRLLLLEHAPGRCATFASPPACFARAGEALRVLQALPCPADPLPLSEALRRRTRAWRDRSGIEGETARAVIARIDAARAQLDVPRTWCHRDYQPQNWIVSEGSLSIVDFEHTRPDHPLVDWVRLEAGGWSAPQRGAFERALGAPDPDALRAVLACHGLATLAWGTLHADPSLQRLGRRALRVSGISPDGARDIPGG